MHLEGRLHQQPNGRFSLLGRILDAGDIIDVYHVNAWYRGTIERRTLGYYFHCPTSIEIFDGRRARIPDLVPEEVTG